MSTFNVGTTAAFQSALAQAKAGDTILLASGTYSGIFISNVNFTGGTVTIASQNNSNQAVLNQFEMISSSGLSFSHVTLSAAGSDPNYAFKAYQCSNLSYDSVTIHGDPTAAVGVNPTGFLFEGCSNVSVTNSAFSYLYNGIVFQDDSNINVSGSNFQYMSADGMDCPGCSYANITDNTFTNFTTVSGQHPDCIQFWMTSEETAVPHDINISGNSYVRGNGNPSQGIFISDDVNGSLYSNLSVTNNTILGGLYNGLMVVYGGSNVNVSGNDIVGYSDQTSWIRVELSNGPALSNNIAQQYVFANNTNLTEANDTTTAPISATAGASLSGALSSAAYTAAGALATIAPVLSVVDTNSPSLSSATVSIAHGLLAGDSLGFTNQSGITGSYNASTGVLTLSGVASQSAYQAALESITFSSSAADPTRGGADAARTISFSYNDGAHSSNVLAATVNLSSPVVSPPSVSNATPPVGYAVGGGAVNVAHSLTVADPSSSKLASASVAITGGFIAGDALNFANQAGITGSYNASTGVLTLSGSASVAAYQAALQSVTFSSSAANPTQLASGALDSTRTVSFAVSDGAHSSSSATGVVTVAAWKLSPVLDGNHPNGQVTSAQASAQVTTTPTASPAAAATNNDTVGGAHSAVGSDAFILGSGGQGLGRAAALASAWMADHPNLGSAAMTLSAHTTPVMPLMDDSGMIAGGLHQADFVLPLLGHSPAISHGLLM